MSQLFHTSLTSGTSPHCPTSTSPHPTFIISTFHNFTRGINSLFKSSLLPRILSLLSNSLIFPTAHRFLRMSHAGSPSAASDNESKPKMPNSIPKTALKPLEPEAGGSWSVTGQSEDAFALTYRMSGKSESVSFSMRPCTNEKDIRAHCGQFFYDINSRKSGKS